jgi:hypothetical protein
VSPAFRRATGAVVTAALVLALGAGCGDEEQDQATGTTQGSTQSAAPTLEPVTLSAAEQRSADSLAAVFGQGEVLTEQEASCTAEHWVDGAGRDRLIRAGVLDESGKAASTNRKKPTPDVVDPYVEAYFGCVDYGQAEANKFDASRPNMVQKPAFARCANEIDGDDARSAMRDDLLGRSSEVAASVQHQLIQCISAKP